MTSTKRTFSLGILSLLLARAGLAQQVTGQDLDKILERGDQLLEEAKSAYASAREKSSVSAFVDAGFKLEEARIKFIVLQEIGSPEKQKLAADQLRAINQLGKLIHDGKVAISGVPGETSAEKPAPAPAAPAGKEPAPNLPPPAPAKPPVDVTKRLAIPDLARQREAEKLIKEVFKDQYAKKALVDRKTLARLLVEQATKSQDDPVSLWVLLREAQDVAAQAGEVRTALEAVELSAQSFDIDTLAVKGSVLAAAGKSAKTPEEFAALVQALLRLVDDQVVADQYDAADKNVTVAVQHARKSNDLALSARAVNRAKEVAEAKSLYSGMKGILETLARTPDDPRANLEMGQFLCYVKGVWDLGARFLVKGSDASLKALAEKDLGAPGAPTDRVSLADGWWELAEKEKSPLRKSQLQAHARTIYQSALSEASALLRIKIEKRLEGAEQASPGTGLDLLKLIDPKRDAVLGEWAIEDRMLTCGPRVEFARLMVPYQPPDEYDLTVVVERREGQESFYIGLARGSSQWYVTLDGWVGTTSGLGLLGGKDVNANETTVKGGLVMALNRPVTIVCSVRKDGVTVSVDEKKLISYKGNLDRLSNASCLKVPNPRALFVGSNFCGYAISKLSLKPVSGQGKKLF
jgi:hypothetical protein